MAARRRGKFIVFEGIDGAGTSTQSQMTADWLMNRGELVHVTCEPTRGPIGSLLRQILSGRVVAKGNKGGSEPVDPATIALLFAADRIDHLQSEIEPHLSAGRHVICDRYVLSSYAYQAVDVDLKFVRAINAKAKAPDLTFFLDVAADVAMARIEAARHERDRFENLTFQRKVVDRYRTQVAEYRQGDVYSFNGELKPGQLATKIRDALENYL